MTMAEVRSQGPSDGVVEPPMVSVICEAYNHQEYIAEALEGFLMQEVDFPVEIIVHDDASQDGSREIITAYAAKYPGSIRTILQEENQYTKGIRARRYSYEAARGRFIALCEGDDFWTDPAKLTKQVAALRERPDIDLCIHPAIWRSVATGRERVAFWHGRRRKVIRGTNAVVRRTQLGPTASVMMRADAARGMPEWWFTGNPPPPVGDYFIEAILGRKGVLYLPEVMSVYRRGVPGSYTDRFQATSGRRLARRLEIMESYVQKLADIEGIRVRDIEQRVKMVRLNYAAQALATGGMEDYKTVYSRFDGQMGGGWGWLLRMLGRSRVAWWLGQRAVRQIRKRTA